MTTSTDWRDRLPRVRIELAPDAVLSRVWIDDQEWLGCVKRLSVNVEEGATVVTLAFHAKVTAEGPLALQPWPILVENEPRPQRRGVTIVNNPADPIEALRRPDGRSPADVYDAAARPPASSEIDR